MPDFAEKTYIPIRSSVAANRVDLSAGLAHGQHLRGIHVTRGDVARLPQKVRNFVEISASLCQPEAIHICDGSETEQTQLLRLLEDQGTVTRLPKYDNCWLARTDPADVARVESRTFICTEKREEAVPRGSANLHSATTALGNWISPENMDKAVSERFPGCMQGRTMYVVPFSMGPIGSPLSKLAVEVTDSAYVAASMRIMTRSGDAALRAIENAGGQFVKCLHSVGRRRDGVVGKRGWPCDPERTIILHRPSTNDIVSYGSGYGGNSLLGKKCLALRLGSTLARDECWLAEHMLIVGIKRPNGKQRYIAAAFPSACGKTNLAMLCPTLPGYEVTCVGDDIAWLRVDPSTGKMRAINPENGFFGVAPGTSNKTNPHAMTTMFKNTVFTNVASTSDGGVFWEGMEDEIDPTVKITDWQGRPWDRLTSKTPAAHPNSRFCSPASQCPIIDDAWENPEGVPIDAILFGGRRPAGVPLIVEARDWKHGVFLGASLRSEATAAAEHKGKMIMHDPFAMRPFFGYNFGHYLAHWLSFEKIEGVQLPKIFHVNWFRKNEQGKFLWPGFGENSRVIDWVLRRIDGEASAVNSPVGLLPARGSIKIEGLKDNVDFEELFRIPKDFWLTETEAISKYFEDQVGIDLPPQVEEQLQELKRRIYSM